MFDPIYLWFLIPLVICIASFWVAKVAGLRVLWIWAAMACLTGISWYLMVRLGGGMSAESLFFVFITLPSLGLSVLAGALGLAMNAGQRQGPEM